MIELNLLRKRWERFYRRSILMRFISFYFLGIFLILIVVVVNYISNNIVISRTKNRIERLKRNMMKEKEIFEKLKTYQRESNLLMKKLSFYEDELGDRILWTDKLIIISQSLPYGMWLEKISYKKNYIGGEKEKFLVIEGFVLPEIINPRKALSLFLEELRKRGSDIFENLFLRRVRKEKFEKRDVVYFRLECKLKKKKKNGRMAKVY